MEDFLAQPHARDAFLLRVVMGRPWSLLVEDKAPLSIIPALSGGGWITADGSRPHRFEAGEILVVRSPTTYTLSSDQDHGGGTRIGAGQVCSSPDGRDLSEELSAGIRTWGNDPQGEDQLLVGTYRHHSELGRLMLQSLPPWFLVNSPVPELVSLLNRETAHDGFAQSSVLDRLLDALFVTTLRAWINTGAQNHASLLSAPPGRRGTQSHGGGAGGPCARVGGGVARGSSGCLQSISHEAFQCHARRLPDDLRDPVAVGNGCRSPRSQRCHRVRHCPPGGVCQPFQLLRRFQEPIRPQPPRLPRRGCHFTHLLTACGRCPVSIRHD